MPAIDGPDVRTTAIPGLTRMLACLTAGRLLLVPILIATFMTEPGAMTACLVVFMAADLYDGVLARRLHGDGPGRRAMDSIVDRIAIDTCLVAAAVAGALPLVLLFGFLARDGYCALVCARLMRGRRVAIKADIAYRGLNFSFAVWAISAAYISSVGRSAFAAAIFVASIGLAVDLTRSAGIVLRAEPDVTDCVIDAALLRKHGSNTGAHPVSPHKQDRVIASLPHAA